MIEAVCSPEPVQLIPDDWRRPGCGPGCYRLLVRYEPAPIEVHDPEAHEQHGAAEAEARMAVLPSRALGVVRTGPLALDPFTQAACVGGRPIPLTPRVRRVLWHLTRRLGQACPSEAILRDVWGPEYVPPLGASRDHADHRLLQQTVVRLRAALGPARPLLVTVPGFGYRLLDLPPVCSEEVPS